MEHEGLQLLCLICGRFRYYMEGCPEKIVNSKNQGDHWNVVGIGRDWNGQGEVGKGQADGVAGPWTII